MSRVCVWVHDAGLSPEDMALKAHPDAAVVFVFDESRPLCGTGPRVVFHRLAFVWDGVCDLFGQIPNEIKEVRRGETAAEILEFCREHGCDTVAFTDHPEPFIRKVGVDLDEHLTVTPYERPELTEFNLPPKRFSRYWNKVSEQVLGYKPKSGGKKKKWHQ